MFQEIADEYAIIIEMLHNHALSLNIALYPDGVQLIDVRSEVGHEAYRCPFDFDEHLLFWLQNAAGEIERTRQNKQEKRVIRYLRKLITWLED